jgi:dTDP-4-amino-4,6-dideoxygalactose transaminase
MAIPRQRIHLPKGAWTGALGSLLKGDLWVGPEIDRFEAAFAEAIGTPDAVAVPSGRAGFKFLFEALGLEPGGEVICSAFGYPVVPFIVKKLGFDLAFVDCETRTLGMDPQALEARITARTQAVIATHLYGIPCQIDRIAELCNRHHVVLIEDCAHCFGAAVGGRHVGSFGDAGCFSFETSKVINTMGGGMVTLRDPDVAGRVRQASAAEPRNGAKWLLRRLLKTSFESLVTNRLLFNLGVYQALRIASGGDGEDRFASGYHGDEVSLAGKMGRYTNYQAKLGLRQMPAAKAVNLRRQQNAERLIAALSGQVQCQQTAAPNHEANYMLVTALMPQLEDVAAQLLREGIDTKHLYMRDCSRMFEGAGEFPNAARAEREALHLPAYAELSDRDIDRVAAAVGHVVGGLTAEQVA